ARAPRRRRHAARRALSPGGARPRLRHRLRPFGPPHPRRGRGPPRRPRAHPRPPRRGPGPCGRRRRSGRRALTRRLRLSLLGHPVRHSVSPAMCTAAFTALGLPHLYTAIDVPSAAGLGRIVDDLRGGLLAGCNVTVPYKRAVLSLADVRAESAEEAGAA